MKDNRRWIIFQGSNKKELILSLTALLLAAAILTTLAWTVHAYRDVEKQGESIVTPVQQTGIETDFSREMSYRELSDAYASLNETCEVWTDLTEEEAQEGIKGGLYFISQEDLEFCIFNADSAGFGEEGFTLADFDHIWLNSENKNFYVVVNLAGRNIDLSDYYILARDVSRRYASRVLINCYEATQVDLSNCILNGTLLAPDARVTFKDTYVYGQVLAKETTGNLLANKDSAFTGYQAIVDGLSTVSFRNDAVRLAALKFLMQNDSDGRFREYTEDSAIRKRDLPEVTSLEIRDCELDGLEQDLAKFKNLTGLKLCNTNLQTLSLIGQGGLLELEITDTPITALDLSDVPLLRRLILDRTELETLDLSVVPALTVLSYAGTKLGWMDYTKLPDLQYLDCSDSGITVDRITGETLPKLVTLRIEANPTVSEIDFTIFPELAQLDCASCSLTSVDLANFTKLRYLRCSYNQIAELDFSEFKHIYLVECYGDSLQSMIVTNWAESAYADCEITRLRT